MVSPDLITEYTGILKDYMDYSTEANLFRAYEFSRRCVQQEVGPDEVMGMHMAALECIVQSDSLRPTQLLISYKLLLEAMMSYGIFYRESLDLFRQRVEDLEKQNIVTQNSLRQAEKLTSLGRLIAGVAHEINNPLTSVLGFSEILQTRGDLDPDLRSDLEKIQHEANRARKIVQNLLSFARQHRPTKAYQSLNDILRNTLAMRSYEYRVSNIRVDLDLAPDLPWTMVDPSQMQQVFINILLNAEQAIHSTDRRTEEKGAILIRTSVTGLDRLQVIIENDGPALSEACLSHLFEPFFTTKEVGQGSGLGLSVVHGILQEHGGEISVKNLSDGGVTFVMELPIIPVGSFIEEEASSPAQGSLKGCRILVVEDEPVLVDLIGELLTDQGCHVDRADNGRAAARCLDTKQYDLILSDIRMPGFSGVDLCRDIQDRHPSLLKRVIFLTGDTVNPETMSFLDEGGHRFLEKPFHIQKLLQVVREAVAA